MTILELYDKVYSSKETQTPETFIPLFEEYSSIIENQDIQNSNEIYNAVMRLTADYAHNLKIKESYTKALPFLEKAIHLFEGFDGFNKNNMNEIEFYRILRFDRGVSNFHKKEYSYSELDFLWLISNNPDNEVFKNWIYTIRSQKYNLAIKIIWYIIAVAILLEVLVDKKIYRLLHDLILYFGLTALLIAIILETIKYLNKKQINAA